MIINVLRYKYTKRQKMLQANPLTILCSQAQAATITLIGLAGRSREQMEYVHSGSTQKLWSS